MILICFIGSHCDCQTFRPFGFTEEKAIIQAIQLSLNEHGGEEEAQLAQSEEEDISSDQFTELLKAHASSQISGPHRKMGVSGASIWETALPYFKRKKFADSKVLVEVTFATFEEEEDAIDLGGPRRNFYTYSWVLSAMIERLSHVRSMIAFVFYFNLSLRYQ